MHREVEQRIAQDIKEQVMNSLLSSNNIEIPDVMHQNEIENMQKESMRQMNITDEDKKPPAENFTEMAAKRVRLGLLLSKIIEEKSITVDTDKVRKHVETMCAGYDNPSEIINQYMSNPQFVTQVEPIVLEEQAIELLAQDAKEKKKKVSFSKYMNN
jgi:trigger factor